MDDNNRHDNEQAPGSVSSDSDRSQPTPPPAPSSAFETPPQPTQITKRPWFERKVFWIPVALLLVVLTAAGGYFYYNSHNNQSQSVVTQDTPKTTTKPAVMYSPLGVVYTSSVSKETPTCLRNTDTVHLAQVGDQTPKDAVKLDDSQSISKFASYHEMVALATSPSCASKNGPSIWLSKDGGLSYSKIYTADSGSSITDIAFATDGTHIALGYLPKDSQKNIVRSLTIAGGKTTDLFTSEQAGVTIAAYDTTKQRLYYLEGCYACDAVTQDDLKVYDIASKQSSTAVKKAKTPAYDTVVNTDTTRAVRAEYSRKGDSQLAQFTINEFDLSTGKVANFAAYAGTLDAGTTRVGYTTDGAVYYTAGKRVMTIKSDGATAELAEMPEAITEVYHVGSSHVIYRAGDFNAGKVLDYNVESGKSTQLMTYDYPTIPFGVGYVTSQK